MSTFARAGDWWGRSFRRHGALNSVSAVAVFRNFGRSWSLGRLAYCQFFPEDISLRCLLDFRNRAVPMSAAGYVVSTTVGCSGVQQISLDLFMGVSMREFHHPVQPQPTPFQL
jgi:hypothetical protein